MDIIVKEVTDVEEKSIQEREAEVLQKHEEKVAAEAEAGQTTEDTSEAEATTVELKDEDVLSYIKSKYNKEALSLDDFLTPQKEVVKEDLPEDVEAYYKYKRETGRGFEDFVKLNRDFSNVPENQLLTEYYKEVEGADDEEARFMIDSEFSFDEDIDDENDIKKKSIAKKKEIRKAKKYFEEQKEKYKAPIEQKVAASNESQEYISKLKEYEDSQANLQKKRAEQANLFQSKTDEVFAEGFKGFEFKLGEKEIPFLPGDVNDVKNSQLNIDNFIGKYFDEEGSIKDAKGYHKALAAALNPDKLASHFYELGKLDAISSSTKGAKNIDMSVKTIPQVVNKEGFSVREVNPDNGRGLKIKKRN